MEVRSANPARRRWSTERRYGYRRVTAELRRQGMRVNRSRMTRIMREDNLLAVQPKAIRDHDGLQPRAGRST